MRWISRLVVAILAFVLWGCSTTTPASAPRPTGGVEAKTKNVLRIPYPNRMVAVRTPSGSTSTYTSDQKGIVRLPDGEEFNPENLEVMVCRMPSGCSVPPSK